MKGFMVFFTLALVASASAGTKRIEDKGIIEDALAMKACLEKAMATIQGSVTDLIGTVGKIQNIITSNLDKFNKCQTLGPIAQAACIIDLANSLQNDVNTIIAEVNEDVNNLLGAADLITACLPSKAADKGIIEDALAMKQCLEKALATIQGSVTDLMNTVSKIQTIISINSDKLEKCQTLGVIQQAACIIDLVNSVQTDVNNLISSVTENVNNLLGAASTISACLPSKPVADKGIIEDALAMKECLEKAVAALEGSVNDLMNVVNEMQNVIDGTVQKIKDCQALTSITQQAVCIVGLAGSIQEDMNAIVVQVQESVNILLGAGNLITSCVKPKVF